MRRHDAAGRDIFDVGQMQKAERRFTSRATPQSSAGMNRSSINTLTTATIIINRGRTTTGALRR